MTNLPTLEVRSRVTIAQGTALAVSARMYHLPVGSSWHNMAPRYLTAQLQQASNVGYRRRRPCSMFLAPNT